MSSNPAKLTPLQRRLIEANLGRSADERTENAQALVDSFATVDLRVSLFPGQRRGLQ